MLHILYCGTKCFGTYSEYNSYEASAHIYKERTKLITWPHSKGQLKKWIFKKEPGDEATTNYATSVILSDDPNKVHESIYS